MNRTKILLTVAVFFGIVNLCQAGETSDSMGIDDIWQRETLTNGFCGLNDAVAENGIEIGFGITNVYQANIKGGISTHDHRGRHVGRYDLEVSADLEQLLGLEGGSLFVHGWGGWPNTEGIDGISVGSAFGINAVSVGNRGMDVVELFYEGPFFSDGLTLSVGKLDFTGIFDASAYADDECAQFLNAALVDDPTIPFPAQGLGVVLNWDITDSWYLMGGVADAQADSRETGFRTALHKNDYFFYVLETGIASQFKSDNGDLPGMYRIGVWNDPQPKERYSDGKLIRDDTGFYISCDQMLTKENSDSEDTQGLGVFARYGSASEKVNDYTDFLSFGLQYQGLVEGRDDDVIGLGFAKGNFSSGAGYADDFESALELYYNAQIAPWMVVGPSIQYITNPGGNNTVNDALVFGLRTQTTF